MLSKLAWALRLLKSESYIIILDDLSNMQLSLKHGDELDSAKTLAEQKRKLKEFNKRLEFVLREHKVATQLFAGDKGTLHPTKAKPRSKAKKAPARKPKQSK